MLLLPSGWAVSTSVKLKAPLSSLNVRVIVPSVDDVRVTTLSRVGAPCWSCSNTVRTVSREAGSVI